jgi:pimeloyl-ACP methyl ester carboxylesterase
MTPTTPTTAMSTRETFVHLPVRHLEPNRKPPSHPPKSHWMTTLRNLSVLTLALAVASLPFGVDADDGKHSTASRSAPAGKPIKSGYVAANGINYYYQVYGRGEPLLLLHGGLGQIEMFGPSLGALAKQRQVIGVDLHGHGRTALGDRPIRYRDMADDLALVIKQLGHERVDVMGYSMGGAVALRLAAQHPQRVRRLVIVSAPYAQDGWFAEMLPMQASLSAAMADQMKDTPMHQGYAAIAPRPQDFPRLLDRMGELMREPYDWAGEVEKLAMPVMLVYGDSDMVRPEHIVKFYQLLGGGLKDAGWQREHMSKNRLAIVPNLTHYEMFSVPGLAATVLPFLNNKSSGYR